MPRVLDDKRLGAVADILFEKHFAARSEARLTNAEQTRVVSEIAYAESRGFVSEYEAPSSRGVAGDEAISEIAALASPARNDIGRVIVVQNPVKRPDDNLFIHRDAEDVLYTWDTEQVGSAKLEVGSTVTSNFEHRSSKSVQLGELTFNVNGKQAYTVVRAGKDGEQELLVRETLYRSLVASSEVGRNAKPASNIVSAVRESLAFANREMKQLLSLAPASRFVNTKSHALKQAHAILLTPELIEKNYGIARSVSVLVSLGHPVFIQMPDQGPWTLDHGLSFYRAYGLEALVKAGLVVPVTGDDTAVLQQIRRSTKNKIVPEDIIRIDFNGRSQVAGTGLPFSHLALEANVLGVQADHRADFPVPVLALRLLQDPALIKQLGEKIISQLDQRGNAWILHQTPAGWDLSEGLSREIAQYQETAKQLSRAA